jgi:transcriptional regulator with XRE-family HTH domain
MPEARTAAQELSIGKRAKKLRVSLELTQQELADKCGISQEEVDLFENDLPTLLETRNKLLAQLWATRSGRCQAFPR